MSPGWKVTIDGRPAKATKQEELFRGVEIPAGEHRIVWSYEPVSFKIGIWISAFTLLFLAGVAHIRFWHPGKLTWFDSNYDRSQQKEST